MTRKKRRKLLREQSHATPDHDCPICALLPPDEGIDLGDGVLVHQVTPAIMQAFADLAAARAPGATRAPGPGVDDVN